MLNPDLWLNRVTDITARHLNNIGAKALVLDVDNTLSTHHGTALADGLTEWLENMKNSGIPLLILSNSKEKRVKPFAEKIGLNFISLGLKPLPFGYFRSAKALGLKRSEIALAGDQLFTDVLGAKLSGTKVILLRPIKPEDKWNFKIRRRIERVFLKFIKPKLKG